MQNIIKRVSYAEGGNADSAQTDIYFNMAGYVSLISGVEASGVGSEVTIITLPGSGGSPSGCFKLNCVPGKNLVTPQMVQAIDDAIANNSTTPLAIADIESLLGTVEEFNPVKLEPESLPNI